MEQYIKLVVNHPRNCAGIRTGTSFIQILCSAAHCTLCDDNNRCKFSADSTLLNPKAARNFLNAKYEDIKLCPTANKLTVNNLKTK